MPKGYYPVIQKLLDDNTFMANMNAKDLKCNITVIGKIIEFIERSKECKHSVNHVANFVN